YYGELSGVEYKLVVNGSAYTLLYDSTGRAGKIAIDGNNVTLTFTDGAKEKVTGTKNGTVITITYNEAELKLYEDITYTVKFETGEGSKVNAQSVRNGKKASKPTDPTGGAKQSFAGWYTDNTYKTAYVFSTQIVTGDITLYARWLPIPNEVEYTVAFDLNYAGAAKLESKETIGGMVIDAPVPTREGYEFKGWWISMTGEKNDGAPVLSYQLKAETVLEENTTAYAVWQAAAAAGDKLSAPMVDVNEKGLSWQSVGMTANGYDVTVTGPNNYNRKKTELTTSMEINFAELPAGDYTITVFARSSAGQDKYSEPTVRVYRNKALARVSKFEVKDENLLVYNKVKNATKYNVYVECGNETHKHNPFDNGNKDNYEFANCGMREEGLNFYVEAVAEGYATSRSEVFNYDRRLDAIAQTEMKYTEATETVSWKAVNKAAGYVVKIGDEEKTITGTSVDLRELNEGNIKVAVRPIANNYNSPKATEITVNKKTLATPANVRIEGMLVKWDAVKAAAKYTVEIAGKTYEATGTQLDLSDKGLTLTTGSKYSVTVKSVNGNKQSLNSVAVEAEYNAMSGALTYATNSVRWQYVFGATAYDVRVNEGAATRVTGTNSARIKLTKEGDNKIQVRWYLVGSETPSAWKELTVKAYALSYDLNGADGALATQYYAEGDEISLYAAADIATEKVGHMFNGWYTSTDDNAQRFEDDLYGAKANTKLYANWKARKYTVTLNYNEIGTGTVTTVEVEYGKEFTIAPPAQVTDGMYGFVGWYRGTHSSSIQYTDADGNGIAPWDEPSDLTLYAQYRSVLAYEKQKDGTYWVKAGVVTREIQSITIPATYKGEDDDKAYPVTTISGTAFNSCTDLVALNIPESITGIDISAFTSCNSLTTINVYDVEGVNDPVYWSVAGVLLYNNATTGVTDLWYYPLGRTDEIYTVPTGVESIPNQAFNESKFSEVIIPATVNYVGGGAFYKTANLKKVTFLADDTYIQADGNSNASPHPLSIAGGAFKDSVGIAKIVLPARYDDNFSVDIFAGLNLLETVEFDEASKYKTLPNGMVYLSGTGGLGNKLAFCPNVISGAVTIPDSISVIGERAFSGCIEITEVVITNTVTNIEKQAFAGYRLEIEGAKSTVEVYSCRKLGRVIFKGNRLVPLTIGESAFGYNFINASKLISEYHRCGILKELVFENGCNVAEIGNLAFAGCPIKNIEIPDSILKLGDYVFYNCTSLESLDFAEPETADQSRADLIVGEGLLAGCTKLTSIHLPYFFKYDAKGGAGLFAGCQKLENVTVDENNPYLTSVDGVLFSKDIDEI
ncbi:MAG: leucine-rich repeat protein, partial [Clostridiales bacterium]|nr:leucine-rich repeat protein [Clostridiales bacterium]